MSPVVHLVKKDVNDSDNKYFQGVEVFPQRKQMTAEYHLTHA